MSPKLPNPMPRLTYKVKTPRTPASAGLVKKTMPKKEDQARTLEKIRAIK
ncbi:MAG: hypothetical protein HYW79_03390 [Parcubacteria group bacterium]|nr:hypothetical protein [Parcubacteria group bacterium]